MYDEILLPVDDTTGPAEVLHHAGEMAHYLDSEIRLLHVADTEQHSVTLTEEGVVDGLVRQGEQIVADAGETLETLNVAYSTDVVQGSPAETIVAYAAEYDYDLIVMPTHARQGLARYLLGSVTEKVVRLSDVPVLTARMQEDDEFTVPYEDILLPTDGSAGARQAANHGIALAATEDATVHALSVVETAALGPDVRSDVTMGTFDQGAREAVDEIAGMADEQGVDVATHVQNGSADEEILAAIEAQDCDAVVMGTTGRRGVDRILLGSVAEKTVRTAPVPVVTVRHADQGDDGQ
ncbi:universal stress protein [Halorhabdus sp. CBA1104]|uniref:universal stress protein n=1 Tax=Halorhabdus sp. CBA1104 TaxID=1380432 RepID=UPI0012B2445F|nr:universal stress protein [Halorhabdus sp. CBA1104]QGN07762.1 universal stress protein [Halorhabdus sp. CBA1104]